MSSTAGPEDRPSRRAARGEGADGVDATRMDGGRVEDRLEGRRSYADAPQTSRTDDTGTDYDGDTRAYPVAPATGHVVAADPNAATRETVVAREKEQFGGIKIGSAFFGWLAATGTAVLLTALVAAAGTAVGLGLAVSSLGVTVGPLVFGQLVTAAGSYRGPWLGLALSMLGALGVLALVREPRRGF